MQALASAAGGLSPSERPRLTISGATCRIERSLGSGTQGEVFLVEVDGPSFVGPYALKLYHPNMATPAQRQQLLKLIDIGRPHDRFLWPLDLAEVPGNRSFGYLMPLRPPEYRGIIRLVNGEPPWTASMLAAVGQQLADSFLHIHALGLCYRDINFGNVFYRPETGDVLICDNDNVGINRVDDGQVLGTLEFMAPEIVRREALPDALTDLHSLAVLLFWMSVRHHPLLGARERTYEVLDQAAKEQLMGHDPLFIYDPHDESNRPDPDAHVNASVLWTMYPSFLRRRFEEAFTGGLRRPDQRVVEGIWRGTMRRLGDTAFQCGSCNAQLFAELPSKPDQATPTIRCWHHGGEARPRYVMFLGLDVFHKQMALAASVGTLLLPHHVRSTQGSTSGSLEVPLGEVIAHPHDPSVWGLRNDSHEAWVVQRHDGTHTVEPGRSARLADGVRIRIAGREVVVRAT